MTVLLLLLPNTIPGIAFIGITNTVIDTPMFIDVVILLQ